MRHRLFVACVLPFVLSACTRFASLPPQERRAFVVSFDGGGAQVLAHMVAAGVMPNLARLQADGVLSEYSRTNYPSKTAAGHASLWTGTFADGNGITSNRVFTLPIATHTILDTVDGFDSEQLLAEPLWVTAARAGRRALVLHGTHLAPLSTYAVGGRFGGPFAGSLTLLDGYGGIRDKEGVFKDPKSWGPAVGWPAAPDSAREARLAVGTSTLWALAFDDPRDPVVGYDTLTLTADKAGPALGTLKPGSGAESWSADLSLTTKAGPAFADFHLFALSPSLDGWLLYHTPLCQVQTNKAEAADALFGDGLRFIPQGAHRMLETGEFGRRLEAGGDGTAEARYLETVDFMLDRDRTRLARVFARHDWDLGATYVTFPDEALHVWYGLVDTASPSYDARLAPTAWRLLEHVCTKVDGLIGVMAADRGTVLAFASDHGMAGLKWRFFPNTALKRAGLLRVDADGQVDLAHSRALYAPTDAAFVVVNTIGRKGGIVPPAEVPRVLEQVQAALASVKAADGRPLVTAFHRPGSEAGDLGLGGPRGGDMYLDVQPGYYFSSDWKQKADCAVLDPVQGGHVFDPRRPDMHAYMLFAGPGVRVGAQIGPVRTIDLAPTVMRLLGLPAPAQATGRILDEAIAD